MIPFILKIVMLKKSTHKTHTPNIYINPIHTKNNI